MAEQQPILLRLGRGHNGFYCPESRFHLVGVIKPQALWPEGKELTTDVKRGVRTGTLVDVNKVLTEKDLELNNIGSLPFNTADRKKAQLIAQEEEQKEATEQGTLKEDGTVPAEQGELLSEPDIDSADKKTLQAFIKDNNITLEGINSRSTADELKTALKLHFGYIEAKEEEAAKEEK